MLHGAMIIPSVRNDPDETGREHERRARRDDAQRVLASASSRASRSRTRSARPLGAETVAVMTPALTLAAHALSRELHPDWWRGERPARRPTG